VTAEDLGPVTPAGSKLAGLIVVTPLAMSEAAVTVTGCGFS